MFYRVQTATTSASKKEGKTRRSLILTKFVRFVAVDIQSLVSKSDMLEHKCMFRFIFRFMFRKIIRTFEWKEILTTNPTQIFH